MKTSLDIQSWKNKYIHQINENEETILTENNSWQDYVKNFNVGDNFHPYEYIREAAGEVLYEFTIGLKKFLEENGITVLDNSSEPFPESTVSFSYYEDLHNNKRDSEKSLHLNWKNDEENNILKNIADYYRQHKDKVSPHGLNQGRLSTGMFFKAKDEVKTPSKINEVDDIDDFTVEPPKRWDNPLDVGDIVTQDMLNVKMRDEFIPAEIVDIKLKPYADYIYLKLPNGKIDELMINHFNTYLKPEYQINLDNLH